MEVEESKPDLQLPALHLTPRELGLRDPISQRLLEHQIPIDVKTLSSLSKLHRIVLCGQSAKIFAYFDEVGHDRHSMNVKDAFGLTPLHYALLLSHVEMVHILIQSGASITQRVKATGHGLTVLKRLQAEEEEEKGRARKQHWRWRTQPMEIRRNETVQDLKRREMIQRSVGNTFCKERYYQGFNAVHFAVKSYRMDMLKLVVKNLNKEIGEKGQDSMETESEEGAAGNETAIALNAKAEVELNLTVSVTQEEEETKSISKIVGIGMTPLHLSARDLFLPGVAFLLGQVKQAQQASDTVQPSSSSVQPYRRRLVNIRQTTSRRNLNCLHLLVLNAPPRFRFYGERVDFEEIENKVTFLNTAEVKDTIALHKAKQHLLVGIGTDNKLGTGSGKGKETTAPMQSGDVKREEKVTESPSKHIKALVELLTSEEEFIEAFCFSTDLYGLTPIHLLAASGNYLLLDHVLGCLQGKVPDQQLRDLLSAKDYKSGFTALHVAAIKGFRTGGEKLFDVLQQYGVEKQVRDNDERTAKDVFKVEVTKKQWTPLQKQILESIEAKLLPGP